MDGNEQVLSLEEFQSGFHDYGDIQIPDNAFSDGENIELGANYIPVKCKGHHKYNAVTLGANPVRGGCLYVMTDGTKYYVFACGGKLYYSIAGSGTFTAYKIGGSDLTIDSDADVEMVQYLDCLWVINGKYPIITNTGFADSRMIRIHGTTVNEEATGTADSGTATTLVDNALTQVDDYWNGGYLVITAGTNSGETRAISDFVAGTDTVTVSVAFSNPIDATSVYAIYARVGDNNTPKGGEFIIEHQERLFVAKSDDQVNGLYWTEPFLPEDWTPEYGLNYDFVGRDDGEVMTGIISYQAYVIVTKPHNVYRYSTSGDIWEWKSYKADTHFGCLYHRTLREFFGRLIYLSPDGVVLFDGNNAAIISDNIEDSIADLPQLKTNIRQWLQSTTTHFDTGTFGAKLVDTSDDELKALPQTSQADWDAGTKSTVDTSTQVGNVILNAGTTNIALNQTATASENNADAPDANDGNTSSIWQNFTNGEWWKVDLGSSKNFNKIRIHGRSSDVIGIEGSNDDVTYTTIKVTPILTDYVWHTYTFTTVQYRYVRFYCPLLMILGEVEIYEPYVLSGNIITQSLDFGFTPVSLGNLAAEIFLPSGTGITFQTRTSADDIDWSDAWQDIGAAGENNGAINSTARRYIQWKALFTSDGGETPILYQGYVGVEYWSAVKDLGAAPVSWGKFESAYTLDEQTVTWWMRSGTSEANCLAASWVQQTPGNIIAGITVYRYIQWSVRMNSVLYSGQPKIDSVQVNYYTGTALLSPCSVVWKDNYKLNVVAVGSSINDIVYNYNKEGYWLPPRTNKNNNIYFIDEDKLVSGTSESDGFVRLNDTGTLDDTTGIYSWFKTKKFELIEMTKIFRRFIISSRSSELWTFSYSINDGDYTNVTINSQSTVTAIEKVFNGIARGEYIKFKINLALEDATWEFHKAKIIWKPLRRLNTS